jgi:hypothetical protein
MTTRLLNAERDTLLKQKKKHDVDEMFPTKEEITNLIAYFFTDSV